MDSLPNIPLERGKWVNIYRAAKIPNEKRLIVQNIGSADVYLISSNDKPANDAKNYQVLKADNSQFINESGQVDAWAFCSHQEGLLNVRPSDAIFGWSLHTDSTGGESGGEDSSSDPATLTTLSIESEILESVRQVVSELALLNARIESLGMTSIKHEDVSCR